MTQQTVNWVYVSRPLRVERRVQVCKMNFPFLSQNVPSDYSHDLEQQELAKRAALDKCMKEARERLEIEMNCAIKEYEIMSKKEETKCQQEELRQLDETFGRSKKSEYRIYILRASLLYGCSSERPFYTPVRICGTETKRIKNTRGCFVHHRLKRGKWPASGTKQYSAIVETAKHYG